MEKIQYAGHYPSAARYLIEQGVTATPRQKDRDFHMTEGIDIVYTLHGLTPANFKQYSDTLLLLAYQEAERYKKIAQYKFAKFEVKLGRLKKGRDLPDIQTYQAAMNDSADLMVYGPDYKVPQKYFLKDKVSDILDITKRYSGKVNKQTPYKVIALVICLRNKKAI